MDTKLFTEWINDELEDRGWSLRELARRAGMSSTAVINVMNEQRKPGVDLCTGIARAFGVSPESVMRRAGLLPPRSPDGPNLEEVREYFNELPEWEQDLILAQMKMMVERRRRGEAADAPGAELKPGTTPA